MSNGARGPRALQLEDCPDGWIPSSDSGIQPYNSDWQSVQICNSTKRTQFIFEDFFMHHIYLHKLMRFEDAFFNWVRFLENELQLPREKQRGGVVRLRFRGHF